jgi:hypothetical protein
MKITQTFWDHNGRKYIEIDRVRYKVPWRYNRVIGLVLENTTLPVQLLEVGTDVTIEYTENMGTRVLKRISVHSIDG